MELKRKPIHTPISLSHLLKKTVMLSLLFVLLFNADTEAASFRIGSYNVENLFDLRYDGTEYKEYIPNNHFHWNRDMYTTKTENIARVIHGMAADIVALQEVESERALSFLRDRLRRVRCLYPYMEIADAKPTPVKCAVLSKFPILEKKEIDVDHESARNILQITLDINGTPLVLFVNHWKSKRGPESMRVSYARALRQEIDRLPRDSDFVLLGDFNSNYNEYKTLQKSPSLNNTSGITGINHVLGTIKDLELVDEKTIKNVTTNEHLYNLWLELDKSRRWSYIYSGRRGSPDNMIVSKSLYDKIGLSYTNDSFDKLEADYLFKKGRIYRWQRAERGMGRHLGRGFSDHLPIFASFSTDPIRSESRANRHSSNPPLKATQGESSSTLVDLNKATAEQLEAIKGIGPVLSQRIIAGRPYKSIEDLLRVRGIGPKRLKRLRARFVIDP
ncbi:MAG: helix-hairpin-helix domain-containing protein [Thermodesulfobacteriota bacterium]|nr:helix-hairpin-helix domain-containing protein [Thermodesulfobacteriota bacterium]